jgi:hypothetical protein
MTPLADFRKITKHGTVLIIGDVTRSDLLAALGFIEDCEECDGKGGYNVQSTRGPLETDYLTCPSCSGSGWQVAPEMVERAAEALFVLKTEGMDNEPFGTYTSDEQYRTPARAALSAALHGGEE